ncbi:hypothetical protein IFM89_023920 [Coptis chinensis]|uniref:Leucine-rich repeat-containing N-terminal plant-type domain-containing protein n=1 Tax=Coptis chinensis TaxID=261450 RepID=A0A835I4Y1_9MAGN|nr:hypothetical protein IFM89_023920 [Coptis chinensis]
MVLCVSDIEALLKLKESFKDAKELDSWNPDTLPCNETNPWTGVICYKDIVYGLRLGDMGLSGSIDIIALQDIGSLRSISFMNNSFTGPIPEFNHLGALKALYLSDNAFSGGIKVDYFLKMESLKKLWMSDNKFIGPIPISLA